ncbi:MAG: hypothetical protein AABY42_02130 [Nitrospirota bacterium]
MISSFYKICLASAIIISLIFSAAASYSASESEKDADTSKNISQGSAADKKALEERQAKISELEKKLTEADDKLSLKENEFRKLIAERDRLRQLLEEEQKKTLEAGALSKAVEQKEAKINELSAKLTEQQNSLNEIESKIKLIAEEKEKLDSRFSELKKDKEALEADALIARTLISDFGITGVAAKDRKYLAHEILEATYTSVALINKLGIGRLIWMTGNPQDDFLNEQLLYKGAIDKRISIDDKEFKSFVEKYKLNKKEADLFSRYLTIIELINKTVAKLPDEKIVEVLSVLYTDKDRNEKIGLAPKLQQEAKKGRKFEDIQKEHPDKIKHTTKKLLELDIWIKDKAQQLKTGEVSTNWTESGYVILKPAMRKPSYNPFGNTPAEKDDRIRVLTKKLLEDLKGKKAKTN